MKKRSLILISAAAAFILLLSIGTFVTHDMAFSPDENRYLTEKPELNTKEAVIVNTTTFLSIFLILPIPLF